MIICGLRVRLCVLVLWMKVASALEGLREAITISNTSIRSLRVYIIYNIYNLLLIFVMNRCYFDRYPCQDRPRKCQRLRPPQFTNSCLRCSSQKEVEKVEEVHKK